MGKFRKMLAGVLSAAMVLSTMTVTAFAAETKMPTIDTTKKEVLQLINTKVMTQLNH